MNQIDRLERDLAAWFVESAGPSALEDSDDILRRTARMRQRPRWTFPERWLPMSVITLGRQTLKPFPWRTIGLLAALALLVAALLAVYVGRQRVPPPFGLAANGLVALGEGGDITTVDPLTGEATTIVAGDTTDGYPIFSRDGTRLAFERDDAGGTRLFAVGVAGGTPIELTNRPIGASYGTQWSPDGAGIAFANGSLWVLRADGSGGGPLEIDVTSVGFPMWRPPDGRELVIQGVRVGAQQRGSFLVNLDDSTATPIADAGGRILDDGLAQWTPDGDRLVTMRVESDGGAEVVRRLHVVTVDDEGTITDDRAIGPPITDAAIGYTLSPDGTRVIASIPQTPDGPGWQIGVVPTDGATPVVETGPVFTGIGYAVGWSPDGRTIVLSEPGQRQPWLLDAAGGQERHATWTGSADPSWQRSAD